MQPDLEFDRLRRFLMSANAREFVCAAGLTASDHGFEPDKIRSVQMSLSGSTVTLDVVGSNMKPMKRFQLMAGAWQKI